MKTFKINGKLGEFDVSLPEELSEISEDYLKSCTDFIHPDKYYALVGIVYKDTLNLILTSARKQKPAQVNIVPIFIKAGECESDFIKNLKLGDRIVISPSDLSLGHHIKSPYNKITPDYIVDICEGDKNITGTLWSTIQNPVCFLEFKLVPITAIHAVLDKTPYKFDNPFIHKVQTNVIEA